MLNRALVFFEWLGTPAIALWEKVVYETRRDSVLSLRELKGRQLLLNDVIDRARPGTFGNDPKIRGKKWVSPDDFTYKWMPDTSYSDAHGRINFHRKIQYVAEDPARQTLAFVSDHRKLGIDGELTTRKMRAVPATADLALKLLGKKHH